MRQYKKMLFVVALSAHGLAQATNWDLMSLSDENDVYVDLDSVKNHPVLPNVMGFWVLQNQLLPKLDPVGRKLIRSGKLKFEVDCQFDRNRITTYIQYSGINGMGAVIDSANGLNLGWTDTVPGSVGGTLADFVCKGVAINGLVPRVTGTSTAPMEGVPQLNSPPQISPAFTRAYNRALNAMGDKASTLKADQQLWWKKREATCSAIPDYLYDACMQKEEKDRIIFLNEMEKAFSGANSQANGGASLSDNPNTIASACAAGEKELFMCTTTNAKIISVCSTPSTVTYRFGPPTRPQMTLTRNRQQVTYIPWDASGRTVTSSISVPNTNTSYQVYYEQDRNDTYREGGVRVIQNRKVLTTVQCAPGTISNFYENTKTY